MLKQVIISTYTIKVSYLFYKQVWGTMPSYHLLSPGIILSGKVMTYFIYVICAGWYLAVNDSTT